MSAVAALLGFSLVAALMAITPGLDTAVVLRTAIAEGARRAVLVSLGVIGGCLIWGISAALGLGALLRSAPHAFAALKWMGAAYLFWLGARFFFNARSEFDVGEVRPLEGGSAACLRRGLFVNLLNPKAGLFYIGLLPQFAARDVPVTPFLITLTFVHAAISFSWFAVLIAVTKPATGKLKNAAASRWLNRISGVVFLAFAFSFVF